MQFRGPDQAPVDFTLDPQGAGVRPEIGFREATDTNELCVVLVNNVAACTMAIWFDGFAYNRNGGALTFPLCIEWKLFLGVAGCMPDLDPPRAVTIFKSADDMRERSGRLFQVDSTVHRNAWLCARVLDDIGNARIQANLRFIFWPLTGRPEVIVGTAVG